MKIKKYLIIWFFLIFIWFSSGETTIWNIEMNFCNNLEITNELDLVWKAWEDIPICIEFTNIWEDSNIKIDFLDSTITQDDQKLRACWAWEWDKNNFWKFMKSYENIVFLKWWEKTQKNFFVNFPAWYKGLSHGCFAYNIVSDNKVQNQWSMFNIIVRKVKFIDVFVWDTQIKSQIKIGSIKTIKDWKTTNFEIEIQNIWNTIQEIDIKWNIKNIFWFNQDLDIKENNLEINQNEKTTIKTNNENLVLPLYKWFFTVKFDIISKPNFDFNIWNSNIPKDIILWWTFTEKKTVFIPNFYFFWIALIFIILIYLSFHRRHKIVKKK